MAQLALGIAGAALGAATGLPMGAQIGWLLGSTLGGILDPVKQEGPRLADLRLQKSSYGGMLPIVYGRMRVPGNVIWQTDLVEHKQKSGGKGGPEITNYTYSASFAIALCEGPIDDVLRVWANGRLVYDIDQDSDRESGDFRFALYLGTEDQVADPAMQAELGADNVPAYRGVAMAVFADFGLTDYGNAIPNLEFEVVTKGLSGCEMRIVVSNYDNFPFWGSSSAVHQPAVTAAAGGAFRVASVQVPDPGEGYGLGPPAPYTLTQATYIYQQIDLAPIGPDSEASDQFPMQIDTIGNDIPGSPAFFSDIPSVGIGMYVYADGTTGPLYIRNTVKTTVVMGETDPSISFGYSLSALPDGSAGSGFNGNHQFNPNGDFCYTAGVPAGKVVIGVILSANGRKLYVFTQHPDQPTQHDVIDYWYEIVDGVVTREGTVIPNMGPAAWSVVGIFSSSTLAGAIASFENNGRYCWEYNSVRNEVRMFEIDPDTLNFTYNPACGMLSLSDIGDSNASMLAYKNGYCVVFCGHSSIIATRFPVGQTAAVTLAEIVADLSHRGDLDDADFDVTELTDLVDGYIVPQQGPIRGMIEPLQRTYFFDGAEIDDVVAFRKRGRTSVATIADAELAARETGADAPAPLALVRTQERDLPRYLNLDYINFEADYQPGTQAAERQSTQSQSNMSITVPVAITDDKAKAAASSNLIEAWLQRDKGTIYVPRKYARLTPTDVIRVKARDWAIKQVVESHPGIFKLDMVPSLAAVYAQPQKSAPSPGIDSGAVPLPKPDTDLLLLDIPLVVDNELPNGYGAAMAPATEGPWTGASLQKSNDGGLNYSETAATSDAATIGATATALGDFFSGNIPDELNTVSVVLTSGTLSGTNMDGVLNGANRALIGEEIVGFRDATLTAEDTYELTGLLRGRRGTEWATGLHATGERFVLLQALDVDMPVAERGKSRLYKAVTFGKTLDSADAQAFTNTGNRLKPYAPVQLGGGAEGDDDVVLQWIPRTRIGGEWQDGGDAPSGESSVRYLVEIWDADYVLCARQIEVADAPFVVYAAADQVADFGATQAHVYFTVAQIGEVMGTRARGVAVGNGASDDAPLTPIPPYWSGPLSPPPSGGIDATFNWATPAAITTSGHLVGQTYVAKFTTGSSGGPFTVVLTATGSGSPIMRHAKVSTDPAGVGIVAEQFATSINLAVTLPTSTDYYLVLKEEQPDGSASATLGTPADMVLTLAHSSTGGSGTLIPWPLTGYTRLLTDSPRSFYFTVPVGWTGAVAGRIQAVYTATSYIGPRSMVLSATPGGAALTPAGEIPSSLSPSISFVTSGTSPYYPTLTPGSTYYVEIDNLSWPPGANASMWLDLYTPH